MLLLLEPPDEEPAGEQDQEADPLKGLLSSNSTIKVSEVAAGITYLKLPLPKVFILVFVVSSHRIMVMVESSTLISNVSPLANPPAPI